MKHAQTDKKKKQTEKKRRKMSNNHLPKNRTRVADLRLSSKKTKPPRFGPFRSVAGDLWVRKSWAEECNFSFDQS